MKLVLPFLIALALSMDVLAVSTACGIQHQKTKFSEIFPIALFFAVSHIVMFSIGYMLVGPFAQGIASISHLIAFVLLAGIGIKMIISSTKSEVFFANDLNCIKTISVLALATSIDAFGIGISFALLERSAMIFLFVLFLCVFGTTMFGFKAGNLLKKAIGKKSELVGGIILLIIGIKILVEYYL